MAALAVNAARAPTSTPLVIDLICIILSLLVFCYLSYSLCPSSRKFAALNCTSLFQKSKLAENESQSQHLCLPILLIFMFSSEIISGLMATKKKDIHISFLHSFILHSFILHSSFFILHSSCCLLPLYCLLRVDAVRDQTYG